MTAILTDVLTRVKREIGSMGKANLKSDNAGCYKSFRTISTVKDISFKSGVHIVRWDFSESQSGKDACDRAAAWIKRNVKMFLAQNNKCETPAEFVKCIASYKGVKSVSVLLSTVGDSQDDVSTDAPVIAGISYLSNFEFGPGSIVTAWRAYNIGSGITLPSEATNGMQF